MTERVVIESINESTTSSPFRPGKRKQGYLWVIPDFFLNQRDQNF
jgi:hypothetical protein